MIFQKLISSLTAQRQEEHRAELYRSLIRHEAKIGGQLFGPVPKGNRREFFCLDERTWVWHEEWVDVNGVRQTKTTRYDVRPNGILKAQDGQHYQHVPADEARNLYNAINLYEQKINSELYAFV